jgi:hypothetical protein
MISFEPYYTSDDNWYVIDHNELVGMVNTNPDGSYRLDMRGNRVTTHNTFVEVTCAAKQAARLVV